MGHILKSASVVVLSLAVSGFAASAQAGQNYEDEGGERFVTAHASIGGKTVTAPIRAGRHGDQVKIPGGSWVDCEITCEYTLRRLTVDFWEGQNNDQFVSPGYFRYDYDLDTGETNRRGPKVFGRY